MGGLDHPPDAKALLLVGSPGLLAHLAPSGWQHVSLTADYLWGADGGLGRDGFGPLWKVTAPLLAAAADVHAPSRKRESSTRLSAR